MCASAKGKVAVASCHDKYNYGSMLQAYATERAIRDLGYEAKTIDKRGLKGEISRGRRSYYVRNLLNLDLYRSKAGFVGHRVRQKLDKGFGSKMALRRGAFSRFEQAHFDLTRRATSFAELTELTAGFDAVVVGSDQLWLPVNIAGDYFTLSFVEPPVRKISYATSFGVSELGDHYLKRTGEFLASFDAVSVREETGARLVERATGARCPVVCDPTMLLGRTDWEGIADSADRAVAPSEPYLLCYFMGKNVWNRECAVRAACARGLKVVALAHLDEYVAYDEGYADSYPWAVGPAEWLALFRGASFVCTDSFHGSVFANLFEVPFVSFRRHANVGAQSTNSRIDTLLGALGDADRICEEPGAFDRIAARDVDFGAVRGSLAAYREGSLDYLRSALRGGRS